MNISRRLAAVALSVAAALVTLPATSPATAQTVIDVAQGATISLGLRARASQATVSPPEAGTLTVVEGESPAAFLDELRFTASASFVGTATINGFDVLGDPLVLAVVHVGGASGDIAATFTPRPAPGPCITLTGTTVDFGDVEVGEEVRTPGGPATTLATCSTIDQNVAVQISDATAGAVTWEPTKGELSPNTFRWKVFIPFALSVDLDNEPSAFPITLGGPGTNRDRYGLYHMLTIAPGSTTGLGEQFSARITFTATAA